MTTTISISFDSESFIVGNDAEFLSAVCSSIPEGTAPELLVALAAHNSTQVQCALASRSDLPSAALEALANAGKMAVRRTLVHSEPFRAWATTDLLIEWCLADEEFAAPLARQIMEFENADTAELFALLSVHPDPDVRRELAQAWRKRCPEPTLHG
ncbi:hypothetical protein [Porphyrobacter sp. HT-58-2]|uniref:hypothetical protein n=1 Tax=Porphyrobacter sp. HT-58-2 TaxID=2023229 RepID=UPI0011B061A3|nr:hypothetical protein [Porphyrobacter sp. HT-58-2]